MKTPIYAADLFAGAGGASLGLMRACEELGHDLDLVAVNHWDVAVETHTKNFPGHLHYCQTVDAVHPLEAVPGGYLDILMAGPECTHFSRARGGKPKNKQSRASAFDIMHWLEALYVQTVIIENVREFLDWGPLYPADWPDETLRNKAIPNLKGRDFRLFIEGLEELGYSVSWRLLKACDFGDPTSRERLFIVATRRGEAQWPAPTHCAPKFVKTFPSRQPWNVARGIIDFSIPGISIYDRPAHGLPELKTNTLRRIFTGVPKFCPLPFLVQMANASEGDERRCYSLDRPLTTVTTKASYGIVEPLLVIFRNNQHGASLDEPLGTLCTSRGHFGLLQPQPYLFANRNNNTPKGMDEPVPTLCTGNHIALCEFLTASKNEAPGQKPRVHSLDTPTPVVPAHGRPGDFVQAQAHFLTRYNGGDPSQQSLSLDKPLGTVTSHYEHYALTETVTPFLIRYQGGSGKRSERHQSLDSPVSTLDTSNRLALCQFVVEYYGNGRSISLADPLGTVTTKDRFGLVELQVVGMEDGWTIAEGTIVGWLDILFRMLQPHELAAAQGFPRWYQFTGTKEDVTAQIGNAWPGDTARNLCRAALERPGAIVRPMPNIRAIHDHAAAFHGLRERLLITSKDYEIAPDLFSVEERLAA